MKIAVNVQGLRDKLSQSPFSMTTRELTAAERSAIKALVISMCANYDGGDKLCLPLDSPCVMLHKCYTGGGFCKYFMGAVLPLDPALSVALMGGGEIRTCNLCGRAFPASGRRAYCSAVCEKSTLKKQKRDYMRRKRARSGKMPR